MFDVIVIGGGVVGGTVLRELSRYQLRICLVEKADDVCMGQSKANSGIVHAGFDAAVGSKKAYFNVRGNEMMAEYAKELGVKYQNNGSLVVAFSETDLQTLEELKKRGEQNGVKSLRILNASELKELEKNVSDAAMGALYAPTGGIVCPYELTIASIGNAMDNGAELFLGFEVSSIVKENGNFLLTAASGEKLSGKIVINCAGLGGGRIAWLAGDDSVHVGGRKGEYVLLDRECGAFVSHTLFFTPTEKGKGILVSPTVDGNILLGPTAEEVTRGETATTAAGLGTVVDKANEMCKNVPHYQTITSFSGVRAYSDRHDFIIEESKKVKNLIHCAGIESPGLTSAPAIATYVAEELVGKKIPLKSKENFIATRKPDHFFKNFTTEEKNELIARDPAYGRIVCRCERITEGEIVRAIHENPPAKNVDAIKRRTRAGMGRCQGGFCQPQVAEILARELNIPLEKVTKKGKNSELLTGVSK